MWLYEHLQTTCLAEVWHSDFSLTVQLGRRASAHRLNKRPPSWSVLEQDNESLAAPGVCSVADTWPLTSLGRGENTFSENTDLFVSDEYSQSKWQTSRLMFYHIELVNEMSWKNVSIIHASRKVSGDIFSAQADIQTFIDIRTNSHVKGKVRLHAKIYNNNSIFY